MTALSCRSTCVYRELLALLVFSLRISPAAVYSIPPTLKKYTCRHRAL
jgi:hypothetical protein